MFKIAGKDFYEYVAYRLKKDKLGFIPSSKWNAGSTDIKTYIQAVVPKCSYDFLVYAHELGHCKSEQHVSNSNAFFFGGVDINRLKSEFNAWVWAIRYVRKLKLEVTSKEWTDALNASFKSYTAVYEDVRTANNFIEKLNDMLGISLEMESVREVVVKPYSMQSAILTKMDDLIGSLKPFVIKNTPSVPLNEDKTKRTVSSNKKHMPWMDMLDNQRKKHQRHSRKCA